MRSARDQARRRPRHWFQNRSIRSARCRAPSNELNALSLSEISNKIQSGEVRPTDVTEACLKQMERSKWLNAFVVRCTDSVRSEARGADRRQASGSLRGPLDGVPFAAKDNLCTLGVSTTASSAALAAFTPPYDSIPTGRLRLAGAPLLGKTNMDEFGMGSANMFSCHGRTLNPWSPGADSLYVPGGSSGGSAAAVSCGACFAALGSDTGGSVRMPAAFCGVVGFKPTYGLIPRHGLIAYASSLDTVGVLTRSVMDSAMILDVIAGPDHRDSTSIPESYFTEKNSFASTLRKQDVKSTSQLPLHGITVGVPSEFNVQELETGVREAWENTSRRASALGASIVEISVPSVPQALAAYAVLTSAEASSNLARYDGIRYGMRADEVIPGEEPDAGMMRDQDGLHREITRTRTDGFGDEVKRRILTGCYVLSASAYDDYYEVAVQIKEQVRRELNAALSVVDVLLAPTTPYAAPLSGPTANPVALLLNDVLTVPINLGGLPAISIPVSTVPAVTAPVPRESASLCDRAPRGVGVVDASFERGGVEGTGPKAQGSRDLPLGMQIIGRALGDATVLRVAHTLERELDFASQVPARVREAR